MNSEKAWYWIAVGTLAVVLGNTFLAHSTDTLQCVTYRSVAAVHRLAEVALSQLDQLQAEVAPVPQVVVSNAEQVRAQTLAEVQSELARRQAEFAQLEMVRPRLAEMRGFRQSVHCPERRVSVRLGSEEDQGTL